MRFEVSIAIFIWTYTRVEAKWSSGFEEIIYDLQPFRSRSGQVVIGSHPIYDDKSQTSGAPAIEHTSKKTQAHFARYFFTSSPQQALKKTKVNILNHVKLFRRAGIKMNTKFPTLTSITLPTPSQTPLSITQKHCLAYRARRKGDPYS